MNPPIGLLTPVKAAIGEWLVAFHAQFYADTPAAVEWAGRQPDRAMAWVPGRMVDQAQEMLDSWKRNDNSGAAGQSAFLPTLLIAVAPDWTQTPGEAGRTVMDWTDFCFPNDTEGRLFKLRTMSADLRAQVLVVASEPLTAMSMIGQLCVWADSNRRLSAPFLFNGFTSRWPTVRIGADPMAIPTPLGEQITVLALDLTFRATMPMFKGPTGTEPNDGRSPAGYPVLVDVDNGHYMSLGPPTGVTAEEWAYFTRLVSWSGNASGVGLAPIATPATIFSQWPA